jgi:hypothetical protein
MEGRLFAERPESVGGHRYRRHRRRRDRDAGGSYKKARLFNLCLIFEGKYRSLPCYQKVTSLGWALILM